MSLKWASQLNERLVAMLDFCFYHIRLLQLPLVINLIEWKKCLWGSRTLLHSLFLSRELISPTNWPAHVTRMVFRWKKHCTGIAEGMGSNPVKDTWNFSGAHTRQSLRFSSKSVDHLFNSIWLNLETLFRRKPRVNVQKKMLRKWSLLCLRSKAIHST